MKKLWYGAFILTGVSSGVLGYFWMNKPDKLSCHFDKGTLYSYELDVSSRSIVDPKAVISNQPSMSSAFQQTSKLGYKTKLEWSVLEEASEESSVWKYKLGARLVDTQPSGDFNPELLPYMGEQFHVKMGTDCRVSEIGFDQGQKIAVRDVIRLLFQTMDYAMAEPDITGKWSLSQEDAIGTYDAAYKVVDEDERRFKRRRVGYTHVKAPTQDVRLKAQVVYSDTRFTLAEDGAFFSSVSSRERIVIKNGFNRLFTDVSTNLKFRFVEARLNSSPKSQISSLTWEKARSFDPKYRRVSGYDNLKPAGQVLAMPIKEVLESAEYSLNSKEAEELHTGLRNLIGYLRAHPESARDVLDSIREQGYSETMESWLFFALEKADTVVAQEVLIEALKDSELKEMNRIRATHALADVVHLKEDGVIALAEMSESKGDEDVEVSSAATLALGVVAKNHPNNQSYGDIVSTRLKTAVDESTDERHITTALAAIGNSRNKDFVPSIDSHLASDSPIVRASAAEALVAVGNEAHSLRVARAIGKDKEPFARSKMAEALATKGKTKADGAMVPALADALAEEKEAKVRFFLVKNLGQIATNNQSAKLVLIDHYKKEVNTAVKIEIGRYVSARDLVMTKSH